MSPEDRLAILQRTVGHQGQSIAALTGMISTLTNQIALLTEQNAQLSARCGVLERRLSLMEARRGYSTESDARTD